MTDPPEKRRPDLSLLRGTRPAQPRTPVVAPTPSAPSFVWNRRNLESIETSGVATGGGAAGGGGAGRSLVQDTSSLAAALDRHVNKLIEARGGGSSVMAPPSPPPTTAIPEDFPTLGSSTKIEEVVKKTNNLWNTPSKAIQRADPEELKRASEFLKEREKIKRQQEQLQRTLDKMFKEEEKEIEKLYDEMHSQGYPNSDINNACRDLQESFIYARLERGVYTVEEAEEELEKNGFCDIRTHFRRQIDKGDITLSEAYDEMEKLGIDP